MHAYGECITEAGVVVRLETMGIIGSMGWVSSKAENLAPGPSFPRPWPRWAGAFRYYHLAWEEMLLTSPAGHINSPPPGAADQTRPAPVLTQSSPPRTEVIGVPLNTTEQ